MTAHATDYAMTSRHSIRAFLPTPLPGETVEAILDVAARAPSGTNMQPWMARVLTGEPKDRLIAAVQAAFDSGEPGHTQEVQYYPDAFFEPFLGRRRAVGWDLYGRLGIARGENAKMKAQHRRNFQFFDAPVGIVFTIDRRLATGSWLDYGMFLQNVMTAARARGLDTCAQAAWAHYHKAMRPVLGLADTEVVVCCMALGYADPDAAENAMVTERTPAREFATFEGFGD